MKYEVGKPHIMACWVYAPFTHFTVNYWATASLGDGPSDSKWIVPGTIND